MPNTQLTRLLAACIAGMLATLPPTILLIIYTATENKIPELALQLLAATLIGEQALLPSQSPTIWFIGIFTQLLTGAIGGAVFSLLTTSRSTIIVASQGIIFGLCLWFFLEYSLLPNGINLALKLRIPPNILGLACLIFGAGLCSLPILSRRLFTNFQV
jgi:hypothetical protein